MDVPCQSHSFTTVSNGILRQLKNKVIVTPHKSEYATISTDEWDALWDTGATGTVVSKRIVDKYNLIPVSYREVSTPQGTYDAACYYIDMYLPNRVRVQKLLAFEGTLSGFDVLIGMDIISLGDFAVTNFNGKTMFSFRAPSVAHIDFVNDTRNVPYIKTGNEYGRNTPCFCDSGKKYKNCCGKI
jgi:predicted aspartyl protease